MDNSNSVFTYLKAAVWNGARTLIRRPFQIIITAASIAIGVAAVILTIHAGIAGEELLHQEMNAMGFGNLLISAPKGKDGMTHNDISLLQKQEHVSSITPIEPLYTPIFLRHRTAKTMVWGVNDDAPDTVSMKLLYGRQLTKDDVFRSRNVCIVDVKTAQNFYKRNNIVGKTAEILINGKKQAYTVVGVVESGGALFQNSFSQVVPNFVYIPYTTMLEQQGKDTTEQVALSLDKTIDAEAEGEKIESMLNEMHPVSHFSVQNLAAHQQSFARILSIVTKIIGGIASISFFVAGVGMTAIMTLIVKEQTREIGIKKSLGVQRSAILLEFWMQGFIISSLGSLIGMLFSAISLFSINQIGIPVFFHFEIALICVLLGSMIGSLFGLWPAWKASKLDPKDTLSSN